MSRTNETNYIKRHETCKCKSRPEQLLVIINKDGMRINADVNAKN